ncbi:alpha/beta hydrolase [Amycolatopsis endophytica]|uniref:Pimeloyl-ACP methyl ester carboxylesterase n=1 Tax=Amycolatopsis endophytica TaxID=860233 RepID=A0A853B120_9PSEU|nr:alpha/beta hydrolase [Amycolatopsis endophytica]NYI88700.1 pimeloyl-ACP methyl ester carboxylesterase [Amycolatopsis endophytica]
MGAEEFAVVLPRSGIALRGKRSGRPDGVPVLCLHGWLDNCASFDQLAERMPGTVDLLAVDLPGHGLSDPIPSATCHYLDYAACVLELVQDLGWQNFHLIGHSLGGALSSLVAGLHPEKILRLVLLDAIGPLSASPADTVEAMAGYLTTYLSDTAHPVYPSRAKAVKARVQLADILLDTAQTLVERGLREVPGGYSWRHDVRLKRSIPRTFTEDQVRAFLRTITAPTLLVRAERTALVESFYPGRIDSVPDLRTVTVPGGHHVHMENPVPVTNAVLEFLGLG